MFLGKSPPGRPSLLRRSWIDEPETVLVNIRVSRRTKRRDETVLEMVLAINEGLKLS